MSFTVPTFFSWDNFNGYTDGAISSFGQNVCWAGLGTVTDFNSYIFDNFDEYKDSIDPIINKGTNWTEAATTVYFSNS